MFSFNIIRERLLWISLLIVVLALSAEIIYRSHTNLNEANLKISNLEKNKVAWVQKEGSLTFEIEELKSLLQKRDDLIKTMPAINPKIVQQLKMKGFNAEDVIADLRKHNELIPYEGILGGKMVFLGDAYVISDKWVVTAFEDGHTGGDMLLGYDLNNGTISWKIIDSYLN